MKYRGFIILVIFLFAIVTPTIASENYRYGYLNIEKISINLVNDNATIHIYYNINTPIKFLILILGKNDLKQKLLKIMNYENVTLKTIEMDNAIFSIDNQVIDYGEGAYWFPSHRFTMIVPQISITTPQNTLIFSNTNEIPKGIGYFKI